MQIVFGEVSGDADESRGAPVDAVRRILPDRLQHQQLEVRLVIQQPVQVEEPLVDHVGVGRLFVFDDHWAAVFIQSQRVDAPCMPRARSVLGRQEAHAEKGLQILFDERLQGLLWGRGRSRELRGRAMSKRLAIRNHLSIFSNP